MPQYLKKRRLYEMAKEVYGDKLEKMKWTVYHFNRGDEWLKFHVMSDDGWYELWSTRNGSYIYVTHNEYDENLAIHSRIVHIIKQNQKKGE